MASTRFGITLQKVIIFLAVFDLLCEILGAILTCWVLVRIVSIGKTLSSSEDSEKPELHADVSTATALISINVALYAFQIALCILLLLGASQKNKMKCRIWCQFSVAILFIAFMSMIFNAFFGSQSGNTLLSITPQMLLFLYKGFMIWMVFIFIKKLRFSNTSSAAAFEAEYVQVDLN